VYAGVCRSESKFFHCVFNVPSLEEWKRGPKKALHRSGRRREEDRRTIVPLIWFLSCCDNEGRTGEGMKVVSEKTGNGDLDGKN